MTAPDVWDQSGPPPWAKVLVRLQVAANAGFPDAGTVKFTIPVRLTYDNGVDEAVVIPKGDTRTEPLDENGSLAVYFPAVNDPEVSTGTDDQWGILVEEQFDGGDTYYIYPTLDYVDTGFDIGHEVKLTSATITPDTGVVMRGVPGGFAMLDEFGNVVNADGGEVATAEALQALTDVVNSLADKWNYPS